MEKIENPIWRKNLKRTITIMRRLKYVIESELENGEEDYVEYVKHTLKKHNEKIDRLVKYVNQLNNK